MMKSFDQKSKLGRLDRQNVGYGRRAAGMNPRSTAMKLIGLGTGVCLVLSLAASVAAGNAERGKRVDKLYVPHVTLSNRINAMK